MEDVTQFVVAQAIELRIVRQACAKIEMPGGVSCKSRVQRKSQSTGGSSASRRKRQSLDDHPPLSPTSRDGSSSSGTDAEEKFANAFAAELLMPAETVKKAVSSKPRREAAPSNEDPDRTRKHLQNGVLPASMQEGHMVSRPCGLMTTPPTLQPHGLVVRLRPSKPFAFLAPAPYGLFIGFFLASASFLSKASRLAALLAGCT